MRASIEAAVEAEKAGAMCSGLSLFCEVQLMQGLRTN